MKDRCPFRSDVRSIVQVLDKLKSSDMFVSIAGMTFPPETSPKWSDYAPREESYFQLFNALAAKISLGPTDMAREIVRFYSSFARLEMPPNRCNPHDGGCTQR